MEDQVPNGNAVANGDVEMKEESAAELPLDLIQQVVQQDPTDPQPPPQTESQPAAVDVSTLQPPAAATPPAASSLQARPGSMPPQPAARPEKPVAHGGPTRQYLNTHVTPHLLEGVKYLAVHEPEKPLAWLADFLKKRSEQVEGP